MKKAIPRRFPLVILPVLLSLLITLTGCGDGSDSTSCDYRATIAESRAAVREALEASGGASMSVALTDDRGIIWSEAFGIADTASGDAATESTRYAIGSVSKVIAAVATMILVDRKEVRLDDPLVNYLPAFSMLSPEYRDITVRMLLNHASGFGGTDVRNGFMSVPFTGYAGQLEETLRGERLKHRPGYLCVYCNDGFTMTENLVRAVTGQSYPDFVRDEILEPLGMSHSFFPRQPEDLVPGTYAESHVNGELMTPEFVNLYATGGLYSTPSDMTRLAVMLMTGGAIDDTPILSAASVAEMGTDQTTGTFDPLRSNFVSFGLGWDSVSHPGMKAVGLRGWYKNGGTLAYSSEFLVLPEERLAVVVCTDHDGGSKSLETAEKILLRALVERGTLAAMPAPLAPTLLPEIPVPPGDTERFSGLYAANMALYRARFSPDRSLFIDTFSGGGWEPKYTGLKLRLDGWYTGDGDPTLSIALLAAEGRRYFAIRATHGGGHYLVDLLKAQKLETKPEVKPPWEARKGKIYLISNGDVHDRALMGPGADPRFTLQALPELPGYLFTRDLDIVDGSVDADRALMFLLIPQNNGRDLSDICVIPRGEEEWLRSRSILYRPLTGVATLPAGRSSVTVGLEGYAEWRILPSSGSVSIRNAAAWRLYDSDFQKTASGVGDGGATLPGSGSAAYLLLFGAPGSTIDLDLVP